MASGAPLGIWHRARWIVAALAAVVAFGVGGYMLLEGWSFLDALYMTVMTLTTVGYREVRPLDTSGRVFTIALIVLGVGLALGTITLFAGLIAEGGTLRLLRRRRMDRRIEQMRDHFIVCAYGRVGRAVARELARVGTPFVVVDPKEELRERMEADGVAFIVDDPSLEPVLRAAGVERAAGMLCAVDSDATNVYITLMARSLNPDLMIVARASEPGSEARLERAGADRVVSPFVTSGRHMALMALRPQVVDPLEAGSLGERSLEVEERLIEPGSPLVSRSVAAAGATVLAIRRADGRVVPNPAPSETLAGGDVVLLLSSEVAGAAPAGRAGGR
jgi:voltage-gated potassium channel